MDKVQKIREELEKLREQLQDKVETSDFIAGEVFIMNYFLTFIDSLQEELVNKDFEMALAEMIDNAQKCVVDPLVVAAQWKYELIKLAKSEEPVSEQNLSNVERTIKDWKEPVSKSIDFEQELYKAFGQVKDFTLGMRIAKWFYDMGRKHKEPVSEELEEASFDYAEACKYDGGEKLLCVEHFKAGSKWQKEQFEKNRLKHCKSITNEQAELEQGFIDQHLDKYQRMPTFLDAIEYGMKLKEQQLLKGAVEREVKQDAGGYPYIDATELYDYDKDIPLAKEGDKYKVVLIKKK